MDEPEDVDQNSFCYSCLNDDQSVECYALQNEALQTIIKMCAVPLCSYCKKVVLRTEAFISNVASNQTWINSQLYITTLSLKTRQTEIQQNHLINLSEIGTQTGDEALQIESKPECDKCDIKVKLEAIEDGDNLNSDFVEDDFVHDPTIKEEDEDYPLKKLKEDLGLQSVEIIRAKNKGRKKKNKTCFTTKKKRTTCRLTPKDEKDIDVKVKNVDNKIKKDTKIETVHLSAKEVKEALEKRTHYVNYINAIFKCTNCIKGFNYKAKFDAHMEKHSSKSGSHRCHICTQRFESATVLRAHIINHGLRHKCTVCGKLGTSRWAMKDHYDINHTHTVQADEVPYKPHKCPECPKSFKGRKNLGVHMRIQHKVQSPTCIECQHCHKTFKRKQILQAHIILKHPETVPGDKLAKRHVCDQCGKAFIAPSMLQKHMIKHTDNKDYYCVECDKSFKSEACLNAHLKTTAKHVNPNELPLGCEKCDKRFKDKRVLRRHMNIVHLHIKPYECDQCKMTFSDPNYLKVHIKVRHTDYVQPRRYPCTMCDKVFKDNSVLKSHIRTHTGERPYQCSLCSATFCQSSALGTHFKLIHLKLNRDGRPKEGHMRHID